MPNGSMPVLAASREMLVAMLGVLPWPALMLGPEGAVLLASDELTPQPGPAWAPGSLRARAPHLLSHLGAAPWLHDNERAVTRTLASGATVQERVLLRRAPWGACLIVMGEVPSAQHPLVIDVQTARLAALGFMVAGVCHEISNPLTSLKSVVQILRSEADPSPELLKKGLDNIAASVRKILDISRRLVTFSRVGDEPRAPVLVDLVIDEALQTLREEGLLDAVDLHRSTDASATVLGNAGQLAEVFLNLVLNAVQAMEGGGRLGIDTHATQGWVAVVVSDSGPGLSPAVHERIFEPFFTTKSASHGTGLGLSISREIVIEHGGRLDAERVARGASFRVELPRGTP